MIAQQKAQPWERTMDFKDELTAALNRACAENRSNTPDYILARYLIGCLNAFDVAVNERTAWYDPKIRAGAALETTVCPACKGSRVLHGGFPCDMCSKPGV